MIQAANYFRYHEADESETAGFASCPECKSKYNVVKDKISVVLYPDVLYLEPEYPFSGSTSGPSEPDSCGPLKGKTKLVKSRSKQSANPEHANGLQIDRVIKFCDENYIHLCTIMWMPNPPHFWTVLTYNDCTYVYGVPPLSATGNAVYFNSDPFVCRGAVKNYPTQPVAHYYARAALISPEFLPAALCRLDNAPGQPKSEEEGKEKEADDDVMEIQPGSKRGCDSSHIESAAKKQKKGG